MSDRLRTLRPVWVLGLMVSLTLLSLTVALQRMKKEQRRQTGLAKVRQRLETMTVEVSEQRRQLEEVYGKSAEPMDAVIGTGLQESVSYETVSTDNLPMGYQLRRVKLTFRGLRWDQLRDLLTRMDNGSPPWRVKGVNIQSGAKDLSGWIEVGVLSLSEQE